MTKTKTKKLVAVRSLYDLRQRASGDVLYVRLACVAARNLGCDDEHITLAIAMNWLRLNAQETTEAGVVAEVNACRDLVETDGGTT